MKHKLTKIEYFVSIMEEIEQKNWKYIKQLVTATSLLILFYSALKGKQKDILQQYTKAKWYGKYLILKTNAFTL